MNKNSEILKFKLDEILVVLLELDSLKKDILNIHNEKEEYFENMIKKSKFFYRLYLNYTKLFIIDSHKLIGKNEDFNLLNLINYCQTNIEKIEWHNRINYEDLNKLKTKFELVSIHFNTVNLLRNKVYAHNDKKKYDFKYPITLKDFWEILEAMQFIFKEIASHFNNTDWHFEILYTEPIEIKNAYKYSKIKDLYFDVMKSDQTNIDFNDLRKIIIEK